MVMLSETFSPASAGRQNTSRDAKDNIMLQINVDVLKLGLVITIENEYLHQLGFEEFIQNKKSKPTNI